LVAVAVGSLLAGVAAWRRWTLPGHSQWQVTMSAAQLKRLVRRTRRDERERVALETGAIPVLDPSTDDLAADAAAADGDAVAYEGRVFRDSGTEPEDPPGAVEHGHGPATDEDPRRDGR